SAPELAVIIERLLDPLGLQLDRSAPVVDARLPGGARVNVVAAPAAVAGPLLTIRRFTDRPLGLDAFGDPTLVSLLATLVMRRATVLVVGATSSGKTSLLNALAGHVGPGERIVTIEDTAELRMASSTAVALEARPPNREGVGAISLRSLVRTALRMRPDRLVVGEVRGAEALDLVLALTTGHAGSMATCHASSAAGALRRLAVLARLGEADVPVDAVQALIHEAIDVVVTVARFGAVRRVQEVVEVSDDPGGSLATLWAAGPRVVA
ncbi:MAG: ATPase, T2SS/T4P/T4SS family, partial [Actinomycetota bacterium]